MEALAKFVKAMFFEEDGSVNLSFATKMRYVVYGIVLGIVLAVAGACYIGEDDLADTDNVEVEE